MPVYVCQPGDGSPEPWKCGIQVFKSPVPLNESGTLSDNNIFDQQHHQDLQVAVLPVAHPQQQLEIPAGETNTHVRRIRHAELVLVDDVCVAYGRYWLRLRWPGQRGGFAGYIAMGKAEGGEPVPTPSGECDSLPFLFFLVYLSSKRDFALELVPFLDCDKPCSHRFFFFGLLQ